jgi:hypothetical protein
MDRRRVDDNHDELPDPRQGKSPADASTGLADWNFIFVFLENTHEQEDC